MYPNHVLTINFSPYGLLYFHIKPCTACCANSVVNYGYANKANVANEFYVTCCTSAGVACTTKDEHLH